MRLADYIAAELRQRSMRCVSWGDGVLVDACREHVRTDNDHPLNVMSAACNSMQRAPDIFEKFMMRGHDRRGRQRLVRAFRLIQP